MSCIRAIMPEESRLTGPDDTTLAQASRGGIRTETLRAYTETEYRDILGSLP